MSLICVSSPKGGVGKTTIAANLAFRLAASGLRIIAIDLDPQNSLRLHFGMPLDDGRGFMCSLPHIPNWRQTILSTPSGVGLLPHGLQRLSEAMNASASVALEPSLLTQPIDEMLHIPDTVVIVDTAPGMSHHLLALLPLADLVLTIFLVDPISVSLIRNIDTGNSYGLVGESAGDVAMRYNGRIGFVLNQFDLSSRIAPSLVRSTHAYLGERLIGTVVRDENVPEAAAAQKSIAGYSVNSRAARDIDEIAKTIAKRIRGPANRPLMAASATV